MIAAQLLRTIHYICTSRDTKTDDEVKNTNKSTLKDDEAPNARSSGMESGEHIRQIHRNSESLSEDPTLTPSDEEDGWSEIEKSIDDFTEKAKDKLDEEKEKLKRAEKEKYERAKAESPERAGEQREESITRWKSFWQRVKIIIGDIMDNIKTFFKLGWEAVEALISSIQKEPDRRFGSRGYLFQH
ncbi:hypothetical protein TWF694_008311 [Orbilia ellipsospora]|uniref:Uncharacterized protein n=1 Tax=Orbilia ellipsospora TaxID=2528407 RepID=A0AAV9XH34_9PEZI